MPPSPILPSTDRPNTRLPELFGKQTQLLGWQGLTATIPQVWNLVSFRGDFSKGTFRLADDDGLRLEVMWEKPKNTPDVSRSVELLLQGIEKDAKKQKHFFKEIETPKLIPSAFGLQLELPEEFQLTTAKMQTGRLEFDWERVKAHEPMSFLSPSQWSLRTERIGLRRISAANVVLENETLEEWAARVTPGFWKKLSFGKWNEAPVLETTGFIAKGAMKDLRHRAMNWLLDKVLRRRSAKPELTAWQDETDNKVFVMMCDLWLVNESVKTDILDSLQSRTI